MKTLFQKYLNNLTEGHALAKANFHSVQSDKNTLLEEIRQSSSRAYQLRQENEELLNRFLFSRKADDLSEQDAEDLQEFADELFAFVYQNDSGIAYRIHQFLYDYAVFKGDFDLQCRQLCQLGVNLYYLNPQMPEISVNLFGRQVTDYFRKGAEPMPRLAEIKNPDTQAYVLRCASNIYVSNEETICRHQPGTPYSIEESYPAFRKYYDKLMEIYHSEKLRDLCPDFPWEKAIYNLHINRCQTYMDLFLGNDQTVLQDILESAQYVYNHQEQLENFSNNTVEAHIVYLYNTSRWQAGLISATELADILVDLIESGDTGDYSDNGITINLQIPLYLECVYLRMNEAEQALYSPKFAQIFEQTYDYLRHAPRNEFSNVVTSAVGEGIRLRYQLKQPVEDHLFNALLFCHPPTYIHVRVAAAISRQLFLRMAETVPEKLIGLYGITRAEDIRQRARELGDHIHRCSLYHDVGKVMLLEFISIYGRKLLDEEFSAIKLHPVIGSALLSFTEPCEMAVIAKYHHRFYNEQGGYPENCPPCPKEYKAIVDIVTVCDSIEAATDDIGRCYSAAKTFPQIISELRREAGTRYSPDVVALFDDETFSAEVAELLQEERRHAYISIYGRGGDTAFDDSLIPT